MIELPDFLSALAKPLKSYSYLGFKSVTEILPKPDYDLDGRVLEVILVGFPTYDTREGLWHPSRLLDDPAYPAFSLLWADHTAYAVMLRAQTEPATLIKSRERQFQIDCLHHTVTVWAPGEPVLQQIR